MISLPNFRLFCGVLWRSHAPMERNSFFGVCHTFQCSLVHQHASLKQRRVPRPFACKSVAPFSLSFLPLGSCKAAFAPTKGVSLSGGMLPALRRPLGNALSYGYYRLHVPVFTPPQCTFFSALDSLSPTVSTNMSLTNHWRPGFERGHFATPAWMLYARASQLILAITTMSLTAYSLSVYSGASVSPNSLPARSFSAPQPMR